MLHVFNMRESKEPLFKNQITTNKFVWGALFICFTILLIAYFVPRLHEILSFQQMDLKTWGLIIVGSLLPLVIIQTGKFLTK